MRFIEKTDSKLSVSNGNVNTFSTYDIKSTLLLKLDFAADSFRCCRIILNLVQDKVTINIKWKLKHFESMHR